MILTFHMNTCWSLTCVYIVTGQLLLYFLFVEPKHCFLMLIYSWNKLKGKTQTAIEDPLEQILRREKFVYYPGKIYEVYFHFRNSLSCSGKTTTINLPCLILRLFLLYFLVCEITQVISHEPVPVPASALPDNNVLPQAAQEPLKQKY